MSKHIWLGVAAAVCFTGGLATAPLAPWQAQAQLPPPAAAGPKDAKLAHGLELPVRKAGEKDFTRETKKIGVEVYRDENNGNLIYVSETGSIAVVPGR